MREQRRLAMGAVDHPEAPVWMRAEGDDDVAGFGHRVHGSTVEGAVTARGIVSEDAWVYKHKRMPMHWADAELLHQAAREPDRRHHGLAAPCSYRDGLIIRAAVSGVEDAEIARAARITCQAIRKIIEQSQTREATR